MIIKNLDSGKTLSTGKAALETISGIMSYIQRNPSFKISAIAKDISSAVNTARYYIEALKSAGILSIEYGEKGIYRATILTTNYSIQSEEKPKYVRTKEQVHSLLALYSEFGMPYTDDDSDSLEDTLKGFRKFVENHGPNMGTIKQQLEELDKLKDVYVNDRAYEQYKEAFHKMDGEYISVDEYLDHLETKIPATAMHTHFTDYKYNKILLERDERERAIAAIPLSYSVMEVIEKDSPALTEEEEATISLLSKSGVIYKPRKSKETKFRKVYYSV